jgi:hypothetical protein
MVWQEINGCIFKAKESTVLQLLEKVKVYSLWWMKTYNENIGINSHIWWFVWASPNWFLVVMTLGLGYFCSSVWHILC